MTPSMTSPPQNLHDKDNGLSRPDTPLASVLHVTTPDKSDADQLSCTSSRFISPGSSDRHSGQFLLPIPTPSSNKSQSSFVFDVVDDEGGLDLLSPEIASADISIAPDGSFVETSSGPAARELKRRYDQHFGVGISVRSPYAITAFVNQHGKQTFRVGNRELSAPAAAAAEAEQRLSSQSKLPSESSHSCHDSPRTKRRSRMSMHAFLPPSMFKAGGSSPRPQTTTVGPRKLRKTRSIPDMFGLDATNVSPSSVTMSQLDTTSILTGRTLSHSVTAADMPRFANTDAPYPASHAADMFGEVMGWPLSQSSTTSFSTQSLVLPGEGKFIDSSEQHKSPTVILQPFGHGVLFDSPSRRPNVEYLPTPRLLREMQSFESGLTARQADSHSTMSEKAARVSEVPSQASSRDSDDNRPPSAIRLRTPTSSAAPQEPAFSPSPDTCMHSRYSTDVFDVLQTYRGLPLLDKLSPDSGETTVIKMSLSADDTAAPRDDPRFVIWGEIQSEQDRDDLSVSQGSFTEYSSSAHSSNISRRKGSRASKAPEIPSLKLSSGEGTQKVLVAATIERWIAQLTSDLNYDELLNFFLTYRTYITAVDLCHLLICRFHWALEQHSSSHDEIVRRIVRVRTFVAIRYWFLTFFTVDFLPNRELRLLVANWLNTLIRDPILEKHNDGLSIVRKLKKVVKDCKKAHTRSISKPKLRNSTKQTQGKQDKQEHVLGEKFAEATRKPDVDDEDSDVDLDFRPEEGTLPGFQSDPVNAHLSAIHVGAGLSPTRPASIPLSSMSILQRTPGYESDSGVPFVQTSATLPIHHNALSRVFVKTIGRLGRWKRVLNSRSAGRTPLGACADVSAFDLELTVSGDLLSVNGGVEQYLRMIEPPSSAPALPSSDISQPAVASSVNGGVEQYLRMIEPPSSAPAISQPTVASTLAPSSAPPHDEPPPDYSELAHEEPAPLQNPNPSLDLVASDNIKDASSAVPDEVESSDRPASSRSSSTDSLGVPLTSGTTFPREQSQWQFDVVSIDELDLSDTSSDDHVGGPPAPPGLRKVPRRLPLRRDFEFVRRSESVSSMGIASHDSVSVPNSAISSMVGLGGNIQQWQMNALVDSLSNDEETGDVEAALRRLEGQINPQKQQEKVSKVDGWVRTIQERMAAGDYGDDQPRFSDDEDEGGKARRQDDNEKHDTGSASQSEGFTPSSPSISSIGSQHSEVPDTDNMAPELASTPVPTQISHDISSPPRPSSPTRFSDSKPAEVVPPDVQPGRVLSRPSTSGSKRLSLSNRFGNPDAPRVHRSYILNYRAEILAEHFSMIDRELFMGVKFEELVSNDWMACEEVNVLDWAQFLKDRALWKAESRRPDKTSALAALRARFNLMANFTLSEVVLTQPTERAFLVGKFIRIAWKAYELNNYNTVVAIITGLQSEWVNKAMHRSWGRIGLWEMRMFKDLKVFASRAEDFRHVRQTMETIADAKPLDISSHGASVASGGTDGQPAKNKALSEKSLSACVPFMGVYLSQLHRYNTLPDLIDPTAPNEAVGIDPITANLDAPAHPEVFSTLAPLPSSMHLEPLINVHKQRMIAAVIKSLVAGQHLASRVQFPIDKKLFQKCLRLRGLDSDTLERALAIYQQ